MNAAPSTPPIKLPPEWVVRRVDDLFSIQQGKQVSANNRRGGSRRPFLRTKDVRWGLIDLSELDEMDFTELEEGRLRLIAGDLLLCEGGSVGRTAMWQGGVENCYYQNHLHRLRACSADIVPAFALYWFWYAFDIAGVYFGRKNVTTIPNMSKSRVAGLPIRVPPPTEQRRMAALLSAVQRAIERQEKLVALNAELKKAVMRKLFTEGTRGERQKETEIGLIPESWEVKALRETVEYIDYGLSEPIPKEPPAGGIKIVSTADINRDGQLLYGQIRTIEASPRVISKLDLRDGDLLFNWRNSLELIGKTTIYERQPEPHIFASFVLRMKTDEHSSHNYYLKHLLNHLRESGVFLRLARRAVNQANYNRNEISALKIPVPDFSEQVEIASLINRCEAQRGIQRAAGDCLADLFRTLLHQLMTAQLRVDQVDMSELKALGIEVD
jgi:type I restriction enzyme, S subunit